MEKSFLPMIQIVFFQCIQYCSRYKQWYNILVTPCQCAVSRFDHVHHGTCEYCADLSIYFIAEHPLFQSPFEPMMLFFQGACIGASFWTFLFCNYATIATENVDEIGFRTYASDWFNYPLYVQKYIILIIARSQEPIQFTGFNLIYCNREMFGKVFILQLNQLIIFVFLKFLLYFLDFPDILLLLFDFQKLD